MSVGVEVRGSRDLVTELKALAARSRRVARRAVDQACTVQFREMKAALTRKRTGLLAKSLGKKVKQYPTGATVGLVGPRHGFWVEIKAVVKSARRAVLIAERFSKKGPRDIKLKAAVGVKRLRGKQAGENVRLNPVFYAHLVEAGHKRGRGRSAAPAYPFVSVSQQRSKTAVATTMARVMREGLTAKGGSGDA